jgi:hypothetical protein
MASLSAWEGCFCIVSALSTVALTTNGSLGASGIPNAFISRRSAYENFAKQVDQYVAQKG